MARRGSSEMTYAEQLTEIRNYFPGLLQGSARRETDRRGRFRRRQRPTRIAFVGEFGAGKSSLINTIWHCINDEGETRRYEAVLHAATAAQSVTQAPRSVVYPPAAPMGARSPPAFTIFDTPGFKEFNVGELKVMARYKQIGIREKEDVFGLQHGDDHGHTGERACVVDHFVWVFPIRLVNAPSRPTSGSLPPSRSHTDLASSGSGAGVGVGGASGAAPSDGLWVRSTGVRRRRGAEDGDADERKAAGRPVVASGQTAVTVTNRLLEEHTGLKKDFGQFFKLACVDSGIPPTVVITHCDQVRITNPPTLLLLTVATYVTQCTPEQLKEAKEHVRVLTNVDPRAMFTVSCYRDDWNPSTIDEDEEDDRGRPTLLTERMDLRKTRHEVVRILHTALSRADTGRRPETLNRWTRRNCHDGVACVRGSLRGLFLYWRAVLFLALVFMAVLGLWWVLSLRVSE